MSEVTGPVTDQVKVTGKWKLTMKVIDSVKGKGMGGRPNHVASG